MTIFQTRWVALTMVGGGVLAGMLTGMLGCKDLTGSPGLPAGTENPDFYNTAAGALGMRNAALSKVEQAIPQYIVDAGLLSDELEDYMTGASAGTLLQNGGTVADPLDERILPVGTDGGTTSYGDLQNIRAYAFQALGAMAAYDTAAHALDSAKVLRGELYAMQGYAEIMLADLFCSGVPLSTLDFQGDFTYMPSSTTTQVYQDAIVKFDTALTLANASDSVVNLARVLKGRAYLDLGRYTAAADDVTGVPDGFQYQLVIPWGSVGSTIGTFQATNTINGSATISDREGENGLPFLSSGDPRSAVDTTVQANAGANGPYVPLTFPVKYGAALSNGLDNAPVTIAGGIEARLIEAEAALQAGDVTTWLAKLNTLRATAPIPGTTQPDPQALPPLIDPVDPAARVDTMFTERAYWLFLDGHRQGDLRRLLRQYSQYPAFNSQQRVYPTGVYLAPGTGVYGSDVTAPVPISENANPDFHGCISRVP